MKTGPQDTAAEPADGGAEGETGAQDTAAEPADGGTEARALGADEVR